MHNVILIDAASNRTEHNFDTLAAAVGSCGPKMPVLYNGKAGIFEMWPDPNTEAKFVETDEIFRYFAYAHLPERLREVSKRFYDLAENIVLTVPRSAERTAGLRKLLEAKDCIIRACLPR